MKRKGLLIITFIFFMVIIITACNNSNENITGIKDVNDIIGTNDMNDITGIKDVNDITGTNDMDVITDINNIEDDNIDSGNILSGNTQLTEENVNVINSDATIYYYVLGSGVRLRETDSLNSEIILQLNHGNKVEYLDEKGDWIKVRYNNEVGYIRNDLLSESLQEVKSPDENMIIDNQAIDEIDNPKIIIKKDARILELWDGESLFGSYPVGLGWKPEGQKQKEGDGRTPEGQYYVCTRNNYSRFYLSLGVSYPNKEDGKEALESELIDQSTYNQIARAIDGNEQPPWNTALGGEIMIHGHGSDTDWTAGCVAVDNEIMDILWDSCPIGTPIIIEP